ncbi:uncharacterized protein LOC116766443 isoform X2 [Danaus plexippus]|uniref:uncharacterized protein LOC116766443 isoform X2 n=1 Tax=Danaus plexippus TaxID=13037 RepID=UPI002AB1BC57|nr:uncharacterized protein LOC116766443 isoform X2 [Danaus plexippus]
MKPGKSVETREEIVEVHTAARSPSPKQKTKEHTRSRSGSRKLSNGHASQEDTDIHTEDTSHKSKSRENWNKSEQESVDTELPIHDQIKMGILGFVEKEIKKSDKNPSFVFYSHDPNGLDEKFMKTLSRPSSGHKEKRSPSYRKKKRHSSRHRDRELHDFEIPGSSLIALEKVDDYLKEYNKDEVVTLSGELEIEANDVENNNGTPREVRHKPRKTRRKARDQHDSNANGRDVSPKVFKSANRSKAQAKTARPSDLTAMLESLEANVPFNDQYIDNPFSSPSPLTSPNDERRDPFGSRRPEKIYLQGGGTFRAVSRDRILESQQSREEEKYLQLDITSIDTTRGLQPWFQPIVLVILYTSCLLVCTAARMYDELMVYQYTPLVANITGNVTTPTIPTFYHTWTHFSIWRSVLSILGLVYFVISNPQDLVHTNLSKLLHFKHTLQSIG